MAVYRNLLGKLSAPSLDVIFITGGHIVLEVKLSDKLRLLGDDLVVDMRNGPLGVSSWVGGLEAVGAIGVRLCPAAVPQSGWRKRVVD